MLGKNHATDKHVYQLTTNTDEQQALKEVIAKEFRVEPKDISIGDPFIKYEDWYYVNAGLYHPGTASAFYIKKINNSLIIVYSGQDCPPVSLVSKISEKEGTKIPIDFLDISCSPYHTVIDNTL